MDEWNVLPDREVAARLAAAYTIVRAGLTKKAQAELGALGAAAKRPVSKRVAKKSRSSSRRSSR
jgi:hypothetical protein